MDNKTIGSKIAKARRERDFSQAQLAQQLFISPQAVGKWERGESVPDIITINRLAEILDVDLNYFSEGHLRVMNDIANKLTDENNEHAELAIEDTQNPVAAPGTRQQLSNFSGSNFANGDLSHVNAHKLKFYGSALTDANFAGADLTGSSFSGSDIRQTNFDETNLTDCTFSASDLTGSSFNKTILIGTLFKTSGLTEAKFANVEFSNVKIAETDLRQTIFENCVFNGVNFKHCNLESVHLDGQTFIGVKFDKTMLKGATFNGATLKNVSFRPNYALTNKYHRAIQTICFDGAMIDKLTYAELKSFGANLSNATTL